MRISQLDVTCRPWKDGKTHKAGNWSATDSLSEGYQVRVIYHYNTAMIELHRRDPETAARCECGRVHGSDWELIPLSLGHGSVSDQQGCNQIARYYGWYFRRRGGAEWV